MTRVLFITKFAPTGRPFGGMIRTERMIGALRQRFDVEVLGYSEGGDPAPRGRISTAVRSMWTRRPYQVERYDTRWLRGAFDDKLDNFRPDVVHVDYLNQAPLVWDLSLPKVLDLHNVESVLAAGIGASSGGFTGFMARRDARLLRAVEQRAAERFQLVTAPSANEAARMPGDVEVVVNGVDPDRGPLEVTPDPDLLCFVGIFSWVPNVDGAVWFVEKVLPLLPARFRVQLVGRNPHRRVLALAGPRVDVTGEVADTWPYVSRAAVVLAPLLTPGGRDTRFSRGCSPNVASWRRQRRPTAFVSWRALGSSSPTHRTPMPG